jgi:phosphoribosyl 1,2-cyclic phosphodiesterase
MKFKIIGSSSQGNCFLANDDLLIDVGLNYSLIKPYPIKYLLLTHRHSDHLNLTTLRKLYVSHKVQIYCGAWLADTLKNYNPTIVEKGKIYEFGSYKISPIQAYHDVPNCGYRIMEGTHKHLHITDTGTLEGIMAMGYESASIECNHDENRALELIKAAKEKGEFTHLIGAMNSHLSVQQAIKFCKENKVKRLYPCHIGESTKTEVIKALKEWE